MCYHCIITSPHKDCFFNRIKSECVEKLTPTYSCSDLNIYLPCCSSLHFHICLWFSLLSHLHSSFSPRFSHVLMFSLPPLLHSSSLPPTLSIISLALSSTQHSSLPPLLLLSLSLPRSPPLFLSHSIISRPLHHYYLCSPEKIDWLI